MKVKSVFVNVFSKINTKKVLISKDPFQSNLTSSKSGGCYSATTSRIRFAWKKFHELIPIVCNKSFFLANRGHIFNSCVRSVLLHACETWPLNVKDLSRLSKEEIRMMRRICSVKISDRYFMNE